METSFPSFVGVVLWEREETGIVSILNEPERNGQNSWKGKR